MPIPTHGVSAADRMRAAIAQAIREIAPTVHSTAELDAMLGVLTQASDAALAQVIPHLSQRLLTPELRDRALAAQDGPTTIAALYARRDLPERAVEAAVYEQIQGLRVGDARAADELLPIARAGRLARPQATAMFDILRDARATLRTRHAIAQVLVHVPDLTAAELDLLARSVLVRATRDLSALLGHAGATVEVWQTVLDRATDEAHVATFWSAWAEGVRPDHPAVSAWNDRLCASLATRSVGGRFAPGRDRPWGAERSQRD